MPESNVATPFSVHLCSRTDLLGAEAQLLERAVFLETFGNTPELMYEEYNAYEEHSAYLVVVDNVADRIAGMIRFIGIGAGSLKSLADIERAPWSTPLDTVLHDAGLDDLDLTRTLDIATLAVHPEYRGGATAGLVSLALYQAVCQLVTAAGIDHFVAILDCVVLRSIQARTAKPFRHFPGVEPARYLDSPASVPVICDVREYRERLLNRRPDIHEILFEGVGFETVFSPVDVDAGCELLASITAATPAIVSLSGAPASAADLAPLRQSA